MAIYGVHDLDFFNHTNVVPNLECAKLVNYLRQNHQIATLSASLTPSMYTKFYVRKDYDDGSYPNEIFADNCHYGGRAFGETYKPFKMDIENTRADMEIYRRYAAQFGTKPKELEMFNHILRYSHVRLSSNSKTLNDLDALREQITRDSLGIFVHDYDLGQFNPQELIYDLQHSIIYESGNIKKLQFGNKFPIYLYNTEDTLKWLNIKVNSQYLFMEYCGIMENELVYELCMNNAKLAQQLNYNITYNYIDDDRFLMYDLPKIYRQCMFFLRHNIKILLKYDNGKIKNPILEKFMILLNFRCHVKWLSNFMNTTQSLAQFCKMYITQTFTKSGYLTVLINPEDARECFQYIRTHNYDFFDDLYQLDNIIYEGGEFVNEWRRD